MRYFSTNYNIKLKCINGKIYTLDEIFSIFLKGWSKETCTERLRNKWSKDDPTVGQCSIIAFIIQSLFGGDVYGITLPNNDVHSFNIIGDCLFDLTCEQLKNFDFNYENRIIQSGNFHFASKSKENRYNKLKSHIIEFFD